ncbi:Motile sperm domain-containing protein 2-like protein [Leptotrombidium deliense]|uniref:Motile sperm domain-containing protein 2-like protein n=1 Tax=Leptotrombidium deliense TaxID=299467 RepID=A0A443S2N0_9ACAR|nr:Motile sperm domain-containing protein 2-like protein [Leptotrombidium deliense]
MAFTTKLRGQLTNSSIKSIPEEAVEFHTLVEVQNRLLKEYDENKEIFDASDVSKIVERLSYLRRFAQRQDGNADKTFEMVKNTLIWRKDMKLPLMTDDVLPIEFYDLGSGFIHGTDFNGNLIFHVRAKYCCFSDKVNKAIQRFFAYMLFKVTEISIIERKGWTLFIDMTGVSVTQFDLAGLLWLLKFIVSYLPAGLKSIILYNLPWYSKPLMKVFMTFIPREWKQIIHIVGQKELTKLIPNEFIPCYIENPKLKYNVAIPPEAKPLSKIDVTYYDTEREDLVDYFYNILYKIK